MDAKIENVVEMDLPPRARPVDTLQKTRENIGRQQGASHSVYLAEKVNNPIKKLYFFKEVSGERQAEMEAYCASICGFLATKAYTPSVRPYYDQDGRFVGLTSSEIKGFISNFQDPLKITDTIIDPSLLTRIDVLEAAEKGQIEITRIEPQDVRNYKIIKGLAICLTTRFIFKEKDNNNSNMTKYGQMIDFGWTKANISSDFHTDLFSMITSRPNAFQCTEQNIENLPDIVSDDVIYWPTHKLQFHVIIKNLIELLQTTVNTGMEKLRGNERVIHLFVAIIRMIEDCKHSENPLLDAINNMTEYMQLYCKSWMDWRPVEELIVEKTIQNFFSALKDSIRAREWDNAKEEFKQTIDAFQELLAKFKVAAAIIQPLLEKKLSHITEEKIRISTSNSIQVVLNDAMEELNKLRNRIDRNAFSTEDNQAYQSLVKNPVFIFHKYKTFLKYILTDPSIYRAYANLNISQKFCVDKEGNYLLQDRLVKDEVQRLDEIKNILFGMDSFKEFLTEHGELAFRLIQEEVRDELIDARQKSQTKTHPAYAALAEALTMDMAQNFRLLCESSGWKPAF